MQIAGNEPYDTYHHNVMHHGFAPNNPGEWVIVIWWRHLEYTRDNKRIPFLWEKNYKNSLYAGLECEMQSLPLRYERPTPSSFVRVVKRRTTANKKERRRTQSINTAFTDLRECIPNVPPDTKLSKVSDTINYNLLHLWQFLEHVRTQL